MHRLLRTFLFGCFGLAVSVAAYAQTPSPPPSPSQTPPQDAAATPTEEPKSLFEPTWHQFLFGGRFSSISGDPARFQRYQDLRDGVVFTEARYAHGDTDGKWLFRAGGDNVGYRDTRLFADYPQPGRFVISGLWDEIPQFYSVDTKTPYTRSGSPLLLDDATQSRIQSGNPQKLNLYIPISPQFDLRERRDIGNVSLTATPTPKLDFN